MHVRVMQGESENLGGSAIPTMASSDAAVSYASPSTLAVANFVTVKPCLEGYERSDFKIWKKQMLCLLESHEMAGFVDGGTPPPPEDEEQQKMTWRRTDVLVQGWILGSIGKDALDIVWDKPTAREMWLELETIFKEEEEEEEEEDEGADEDGFSKYLNLHQAAMRGNWDVAINFFPDRMQLSTTVITSKLETTLHIAAMTGKSNLDFVKKLVELMPPEALALKDRNKDIALDNAIVIGNIEAAKAMIKKKPDLLFFANSAGRMPVQEAALNSHREILEYLLSEHEYCYEDGVPLFKSQDGITTLNAIIACGFIDIALDLVHKYPDLARLTYVWNGRSALSTISETPLIHEDGNTLVAEVYLQLDA